jgi:hypothetical protein
MLDLQLEEAPVLDFLPRLSVAAQTVKLLSPPDREELHSLSDVADLLPEGLHRMLLDDSSDMVSESEVHILPLE